MPQPTAPAPGVVARSLHKRFGPLDALGGVDLDVPRGNIVALLGVNGAGKSTLLRILGTTLAADTGTASVAGCDVVTDPLGARRSVGFFLGDERSWYWRLTGRHNLEFFAALYGLDKAGACERSDRLLREVGLADAAERAFSGYSAGMRLRLSLARALLRDPPVLLFDEPTRSLDPLGTIQFRQTVLDIVSERNAAVLFATHDLHEAAALADTVVVLSGGRIVSRTDGEVDAAALEQALTATIA